MTFAAGARPHPEALRDAIRRVDFTPTEVRFWVEGTLESGPGSTRTLVSRATGQRFVLEPAPGATGRAIFESLSDLRGTVTLRGLVEAAAEAAGLVLRVEGDETLRR